MVNEMPSDCVLLAAIHLICDGILPWSMFPDPDDEAVRQGLVSITPVSLYLTHYPALVRLRRWMELSQRSVQNFDGASGRESHSLQHVERS